MPDNEYRELVERKDWNRDERKREDVGRRSNDGGDYENSHEGMAAIALHERGFEKPGLGKQPRQHRQLEHNAHEQKQQEERVDVGVEGDKIRHSLIHLIIPQERDGEWNDNEISHQRAQHEHDEAAEDEQRGDAALCPVKRRRDEAEKDVKYKRRSDEQREIE